MSATVLYMSMSLDGFIAGPNERPDNGLGDGGHRLHEWVLAPAHGDRQAIAERAAGVNGQSRRDPGSEPQQWPLVTYVDDVTTAMSEAKRDIELERTRILEGEGGVTHLRYRVQR